MANDFFFWQEAGENNRENNRLNGTRPVLLGALSLKHKQ